MSTTSKTVEPRPVERPADPNCRDCNGTGVVGAGLTGLGYWPPVETVMCRCRIPVGGWPPPKEAPC